MEAVAAFRERRKPRFIGQRKSRGPLDPAFSAFQRAALTAPRHTAVIACS
jgi:hypothetical protein